MSNSRLLLVCADPLESRLLTLALEQAGLTLTAIPSLENVASTPQAMPQPHLIMLVNHDGRYLAAARTLRQRFHAPLLLLADYQTEDEHLDALQAGVDLILFRSYSIRFLAEQIPTLLRRFTHPDAIDAPTTPDAPPEMNATEVTSGSVRLNASTKTLHVAGDAPARLSQLEFRLLHLLMSRPQQVIPMKRLIEHVYGYHGDGDEELMRKLVCRVRAKLKDNGREPCFIHTIPGVGYTFQERNEHQQCAHHTPTH